MAHLKKYISSCTKVRQEKTFNYKHSFVMTSSAIPMTSSSYLPSLVGTIIFQFKYKSRILLREFCLPTFLAKKEDSKRSRIECSKVVRSVTRNGEILPLWQSFSGLWQLVKGLFSNCNIITYFWQIYCAIGLIFIVAKGQTSQK